ncbi:MAG: hypothetical protein ACOYYS_19355 [Chloroflexota bacterium]
MNVLDYPVAFCYKPNTWPPALCEGVKFDRHKIPARKSYPNSEYRFERFVDRPSDWINVHTETRKKSNGKLTPRWHNDIEFDDAVYPGLGPFVEDDNRLVCDNWILITDQEAFDEQYKAWLKEQFTQGDMSHLVQGTLF